jgi:hypothetical protein
MTAPAERAMRAWVNGQAGLVGPGHPLAKGAYTGHQVRSPASGAYCVVARQGGQDRSLLAEADVVATARLSFMVYAGTVESAEDAATALATAVNALNGLPEPCGDTGYQVLASDNVFGPSFVAMPAQGGEEFCFQVAADVVLAPV